MNAGDIPAVLSGIGGIAVMVAGFYGLIRYGIPKLDRKGNAAEDEGRVPEPEPEDQP
jgi:hypothetical protein